LKSAIEMGRQNHGGEGASSNARKDSNWIQSFNKLVLSSAEVHEHG